MSITGWRAYFTRRDLEWPREKAPFMREFSSLFADLGEGLDDLGVPEGRPFPISPAGGYDVALNRCFSVWLASCRGTPRPHRPGTLRTYFDFLWFARGRQDWRDASMDDRAAS